MKIYFLIITFCLLTIHKFSIAQNSFSKYYDNNIYGDRIFDQGKNFLELDDSTFIFPSSSMDLYKVDTLGYSMTYLQIIRTNKNGDELVKKIYRIKHNAIRVYEIVKFGNNFILAGDIVNLVDYDKDSTGAEILLVKINLNGDTLWTKTLGIGDGDELVSRIINTSDGGFAIFGQTCNKQETNCDYYLMKVDSNGNKLWHKTYSLNANSWELPQSVIETKEKGFLMVGHTTGGISSVIVKTDSSGKQLWKKSFNKNGSAFSFVSNVYHAENNTYLFVGGIGNSVSHKGWILRTDTSGKFIKEIRVGIDGYYTTFIALAERDNKIYVQGETKEYLPPQTENLHTCLYAFTSTGDPLWRRIYPDSLVKNRRYLIYDMKPTLDNGFAMIGFGMDPKTMNPQNNQDVWFLKVDSNGCLYQPCVDMTVGIADDKEIISKVILFPNPCKDVLNITLDEEIEEVSVYNSIGQLLLQENILINNQINIEQIPNGFLFVKIKTKGGELYSEKVWKEKL
jgi:hypothetical protein